eukprot:scaffold776_cov347-Pavlova_lutheri.AAC.53
MPTSQCRRHRITRWGLDVLRQSKRERDVPGLLRTILRTPHLGSIVWLPHRLAFVDDFSRNEASLNNDFRRRPGLEESFQFCCDFIEAH